MAIASAGQAERVLLERHGGFEKHTFSLSQPDKGSFKQSVLG
jgi:hypothetical protein